ncbi:MAG TPA: hypothetical protein VHA70_12020 [Bauldia sp.]|nr:hypothetical protein [Bauldia sp.]
MRIVLAAAFLAAAASAHAEEGRYVLSAARDGFVRLDTATGAASHCAPTRGVWRCEPLPIEETRLDALATEVAALTAKVAALSARVGALPAGTATAPAIEPTPRPSFVHEALDRLLSLVRTLKHGRDA